MGLIISSVVAGGTMVLEDLETPYEDIKGRKRSLGQRIQTKVENGNCGKPHWRGGGPLIRRTPEAPAVPPTPTHHPHHRPSSRARTPLQRQNSVHSLPSPSKAPREELVPSDIWARAATGGRRQGKERRQSSSPLRQSSPRRQETASRERGRSETPAKTPRSATPSSPQHNGRPKTPSGKKDTSQDSLLDNPDTNPMDPLEKEASPGLLQAVEDTILTMFQRVDNTVIEDTYLRDMIIEEDEESVKTTNGEYRVSPTLSSKLRRQSEDRKRDLFENMAAPRKDEFQVYAGNLIPKSRRSSRTTRSGSRSPRKSGKSKTVVHPTEWID